jgi:hypothetical protein
MTKNVFLPLFNIDYLLIFWFKILAHCAMLQCMSWYNKPPWVALTTTASLTITIKLGAIKYFFVNNTKIFVTSSVLKLQKWFLHQNGVESNQESKSDMYKLLGGAWRCVRYQKMCSRWHLAWYHHLAWLDIVAHCALCHWKPGPVVWYLHKSINKSITTFNGETIRLTEQWVHTTPLAFLVQFTEVSQVESIMTT